MTDEALVRFYSLYKAAEVLADVYQELRTALPNSSLDELNMSALRSRDTGIDTILPDDPFDALRYELDMSALCPEIKELENQQKHVKELVESIQKAHLLKVPVDDLRRVAEILDIQTPLTHSAKITPEGPEDLV